jgi:hypothetical protein
MSRYTEGDWDDWDANLGYGRWEWNSRQALKGRKGRQALRELREALLALPEKRLIEGAVCTVGAEERKARHMADATRLWESTPPEYRWSRAPLSDEAERLESRVSRDGEGVCAVGALLWHRAVKAGADPAEAFASLPDVAAEDSDGLADTASLARAQAGMTFTLAWNLAYRNDETLRGKTPEERYEAFLTWIERELAEAGTP